MLSLVNSVNFSNLFLNRTMFLFVQLTGVCPHQRGLFSLFASSPCYFRILLQCLRKESLKTLQSQNPQHLLSKQMKDKTHRNRQSQNWSSIKKSCGAFLNSKKYWSVGSCRNRKVSLSNMILPIGNVTIINRTFSFKDKKASRLSTHYESQQ